MLFPFKVTLHQTYMDKHYSYPLLSKFAYAILAGILGFLGAYVLLLVLFNDSSKKGTSFQEIRIEGTKHGIIKLLQTRLTYVDTLVARTKKEIETLKCWPKNMKAPQCITLGDSLKAYLGYKERISKDLYNLRYNNSDSMPAYYAKYLTMDATELRQIIQQFSNKKEVTVYPVDSIYLENGDGKPLMLTFQQESGDSLVEFISRNPILGFWIILSFGQMSMWLLLTVLLCGWAKEVTISEKHGNLFWKSLIVPLIGVLPFTLVFYYKLVDEFLFPDAVILNSFQTKMLIYAIVGYSAAVVCFAVYVSSAAQLDYINKLYIPPALGKENLNLDTVQGNDLVKDVNPEIVQKNDLLKNASPDTVQGDDLVMAYHKITTLFNGAFLITAIILSLFILWLAILFNGINQMEVMQFYTQLSHRPFLNGDFVYMVALFHTILLLLFYLPIKLKFNGMQINQELNQGSENSKKGFKFLAESLGTILMTTSPLITSIVEKAISNLF
jgi:hypothetical protein